MSDVIIACPICGENAATPDGVCVVCRIMAKRLLDEIFPPRELCHACQRQIGGHVARHGNKSYHPVCLDYKQGRWRGY